MNFNFLRPPSGKFDTSNLIEKMFPPAALWQVLFLIATTVLVSMWNLDMVREFVFDSLERGRQERAVQALTDSSDKIASDACYSLLSTEDSTYYATITDILYQRPHVSFTCLSRAAEPEPTEASPPEVAVQDAPDAGTAQEAPDAGIAEDSAAPKALTFSEQESQSWPETRLSTGTDGMVPNYVLVASTLGSLWMNDLIRGSDNTCQTALNARRALDLARVDPTYRMMSCALGADSAEVRECCVSQVGGHEAFTDLLDDSGRVPLIPASFDYRALVGSAFPEVPLASELLGRRYQRWEAEVAVPSAEERAERGEERFGNLQYDVQDWVVEVGCDIHYNLPSRGLVPAAFVPLVEAQGCSDATPPWAGMYSPASWSDMCLGMYHERRAMGASPRDAICDSLATSTVGRSVLMANMIVLSALSSGTQLPGVRRKKLELSGSNFGERINNPHSKEARRRKERELNGAPWAVDLNATPMH